METTLLKNAVTNPITIKKSTSIYYVQKQANLLSSLLSIMITQYEMENHVLQRKG